jgi:hypothetical protein
MAAAATSATAYRPDHPRPAFGGDLSRFTGEVQVLLGET